MDVADQLGPTLKAKTYSAEDTMGLANSASLLGNSQEETSKLVPKTIAEPSLIAVL